MLAEHIEAALRGPLTRPALEEVARQMWCAFAEGHLTEAEAERLDGLIRERQARMRAQEGQGGVGGLLRASAVFSGVLAVTVRRARQPRSADRQASLERRRGVAFSGGMPSELARLFTPGQVAVLSVVGREATRGRPSCEMPLAKIGALAGAGRSTVQEALRAAKGLGLIWVRERRRRGERSQTNVVTVLSKAWWRWLKRHMRRVSSEKGGEAQGPRGGGFGKSDTTNTQELRRGQKAAESASGGPKGPREDWPSRRGRDRGPESPERGRPRGVERAPVSSDIRN